MGYKKPAAIRLRGWGYPWNRLMTMHSRHAVTISVPTYSQGDGQMNDPASSASQSVWRWWLAFTAHPAGPPVLAWLYRATVISSAVLATLKLAYSIRFGKRLD